MSKTPNYDAKVKVLLDATQAGERVCALTGEKWMMTEEEIGWYKRFMLPPSTWAPMTRIKLYSSFYTIYQWWYQKHPETAKQIVTWVHPATGIRVLPDAEWFEKDYITAGSAYDASQPFMEQFSRLLSRIPFPAQRNNKPPERSIAIYSYGDVDSYFDVAAGQTKNSQYIVDCFGVESSCEAQGCSNITSCYNVTHCHRIYNGKFLRECHDCVNSQFLFDCRNCENCFGATNKRNRKYLFWNEQLSKDAWEQKMREVDLSHRSNLEGYKKRFHDLVHHEAIWPEHFNTRAENCIGEYLENATDCRYCWFGIDGHQKNNFWCNYLIGNAENNAFVGTPAWSNECYACADIANCSRCRFVFTALECQSVEYSMMMYNCENCFGCVGLRHKKFCIFNTQHTEEEYWKRVDELKCAMLDRNEYGLFFPLSLSPSYFFDSGAVIYLMDSEEEARKLGARIYEPESAGAIDTQLADNSKIRDVSEVPENLSDLSDEWVGVPLYDKEARRRFAFIRPEVEFYRAHKLAPPNRHFIRRVQDLFRQSNSGIFDTSTCEKCQKQIGVMKNAVYPEHHIYCKPCYLQFIEKNG